MPPDNGKVFPVQFHEVENKWGREEKVDGKVGSAWADGKQGNTGEFWVSTAGEQLHSFRQTQETASTKKPSTSSMAEVWIYLLRNDRITTLWPCCLQLCWTQSSKPSIYSK